MSTVDISEAPLSACRANGPSKVFYLRNHCPSRSQVISSKFSASALAVTGFRELGKADFMTIWKSETVKCYKQTPPIFYKRLIVQVSRQRNLRCKHEFFKRLQKQSSTKSETHCFH